MPSWFDVFEPINQDDYQCLSVIAPNPAKGATQWTINGQWITIGIYRDEGRDPAQSPINDGLSWTRVGTKLTLNTVDPHFLTVGDKISVYNVNIAELKNVLIKEVLSPTSFTVITFGRGATSGAAGAYQEEFLTIFSESRVVFRLLPSFKLVPISVVQALFDSSKPPETAAQRTFYNITSKLEVATPRGRSASVNYELPSTSARRPAAAQLARRFGQAYDEVGAALPVRYLPNGQPVPINNVDSRFKNDQRFFLQPVKEPELYNQNGNPRLYVYDFYGFDLNDATRGPFFSDANVVIDQTSSNDLAPLSIKIGQDGLPFYNKKIHDEFGNLAIAVQQDSNALLVRKQILPIPLDKFNRPIGYAKL